MPSLGNRLGVPYDGMGNPAGAPPFANTRSFDLSSAGRLYNLGGMNGVANGSSWAYSAWFKSDIHVKSSVQMLQCSITPGASSYIQIYNVGSGPGYIILEHILSNPSRRNQYWLYGTNATYRDGNWHQLVITFTSYDYNVSDIRMYLDGVAVGSVLRNEMDASDMPWNTNADVASVMDTSARPGFKMDEIAIWGFVPPISDVYGGGTVVDLSTIGAGPLNWFRGELNTDDSGSRGDVPGIGGTIVYSTDVP